MKVQATYADQPKPQANARRGKSRSNNASDVYEGLFPDGSLAMPRRWIDSPAVVEKLLTRLKRLTSAMDTEDWTKA